MDKDRETDHSDSVEDPEQQHPSSLPMRFITMTMCKIILIIIIMLPQENSLSMNSLIKIIRKVREVRTNIAIMVSDKCHWMFTPLYSND